MRLQCSRTLFVISVVAIVVLKVLQAIGLAIYVRDDWSLDAEILPKRWLARQIDPLAWTRNAWLELGADEKHLRMAQEQALAWQALSKATHAGDTGASASAIHAAAARAAATANSMRQAAADARGAALSVASAPDRSCIALHVRETNLNAIEDTKAVIASFKHADEARNCISPH